MSSGGDLGKTDGSRLHNGSFFLSSCGVGRLPSND